MATGDEKNLENGVEEVEQPEAESAATTPPAPAKPKGDDAAAQRRIDEEKARLKAENEKLKAENDKLLSEAKTQEDVKAAREAHEAELRKIDILAERGKSPSLRKFIQSTDREGILAEIDELAQHFPAATVTTTAKEEPAQAEKPEAVKPAAPERPEPRAKPNTGLDKPFDDMTGKEMQEWSKRKAAEEAKTLT